MLLEVTTHRRSLRRGLRTGSELGKPGALGLCLRAGLLLLCAVMGSALQAQIAEGSTLEKALISMEGYVGLAPDAAASAPDSAATNAARTDADATDSTSKPTRKVRVWLPPGYPDQAPYPLLILLDGQNLFDALTAFAGEWGVDEHLLERQAQGLPVPVVVGVDNGAAQRIHEYSWHPHPEYGGGGGMEHLAFIEERVLPWVRDRYALSRERAMTGLGGSSLGGLMALWAGVQEESPFGFLLGFSPSLWFNPQLLDSAFLPAPESRWYLAMGSQEASSEADQALRFDALPLDPNAGNLLEFGNRLRRLGCGPARLHVLIDPKGQHRESTWQGWFGDAIRWWLDGAAQNDRGQE